MFRRSRISEVSPIEARRLQEEGATLLDVREPHEYTAGHAPEAVHLPLDRLAEFPAGDHATVLTVCRSGRRSNEAARALAAAGVDARNVWGGMSAWARSGLPVVSDRGIGGRVV